MFSFLVALAYEVTDNKFLIEKAYNYDHAIHRLDVDCRDLLYSYFWWVYIINWFIHLMFVFLHFLKICHFSIALSKYSVSYKWFKLISFCSRDIPKEKINYNTKIILNSITQLVKNKKILYISSFILLEISQSILHNSEVKLLYSKMKKILNEQLSQGDTYQKFRILWIK